MQGTRYPTGSSPLGTDAPPPEAGSALGHGLPQPLVLSKISSASHVGGDISAGRAALPGDRAGSWPPHRRRKRRKRRKVALESPRERGAASGGFLRGSWAWLCPEVQGWLPPHFLYFLYCVFRLYPFVSNDAFPPLGVNTSSLAVYLPSV